MSFKITNKEVVEEIIYTDVVFTFKDGTEVETRIAHFMPQNKAEIIDNIKARGLSERQKKNATAKNSLLIATITTNEIVEDNEEMI